MKLYTVFGQNAQTDLFDLLMGESLTDYEVVVVSSPKGLPIALRDKQFMNFPELYNPTNGTMYLLSLSERRVITLSGFKVLDQEELTGRLRIESRLSGKLKTNYLMFKTDTEDIGGVLEQLRDKGFEFEYREGPPPLTDVDKKRIWQAITRERERIK